MEALRIVHYSPKKWYMAQSMNKWLNKRQEEVEVKQMSEVYIRKCICLLQKNIIKALKQALAGGSVDATLILAEKQVAIFESELKSRGLN